MSDTAKNSLLRNYISVFGSLLLRTDLEPFVKNHRSLFKLAKEKQDYCNVATHYYDLMEDVIGRSYGESWILCPPEFKGQSRKQAISSLHQRICRFLDHGPGKTTLDMGCGLGGAAREIAFFSGGIVHGVTLSRAEVETASVLSRENGLEELCKFKQGNYTQELPFNDDSFDSAYSIYSLKYLPVSQLPLAFAQAQRVLKPGSNYVVYDAVLTSKYRAESPHHRKIVEDLEYSIGMPPLHTRENLIDAALENGLTLISEQELSQHINWNYFLAKNWFLGFVLRSKAVRMLIGGLEGIGVLPRGFTEFYKYFLADSVNALVDAGRLDIVSFSRLFVFRK